MKKFRVTYLQKDGFDCNTITVEAVSSVEAEQKVKQMPDCDAVLAIIKKQNEKDCDSVSRIHVSN